MFYFAKLECVDDALVSRVDLEDGKAGLVLED
jgi:hypothetical protein